MHESRSALNAESWGCLVDIQRAAFGLSGIDLFETLCARLIKALDADYCIVGQIRSMPDHQPQVDTLAVAFSDNKKPKPLKNFSYPLAGTPCEAVTDNRICVIPSKVTEQYPADQLLVEMAIEAYVGAPLFGQGDSVHGIVSLLYTRPLSAEESAQIAFVLEIFAMRCATELDRQQAEYRIQRNQYYVEAGFNHSPLAMLMLDSNGCITHGNRAFRDLTGHFEASIRGQAATVYFAHDQQSAIAECLQELLSGAATQMLLESIIVDRVGQQKIVTLSAYTLHNSEGRPVRLVLQMDDVTERKHAEQEFSKLLQSIESSPVATVMTDPMGIIEYVNPRFTELTGYSKAEAIGKRTNISSSGETPAEVYDVMWQNILSGHQWQGELLNRRKDGTNYWARTTIFPIRDGQNNITNFVSLQEDVSEARSLVQKMYHQATHDQLTGLINRGEFQRRLALAIEDAVKNDTCHSLCFLDLDQFKVVNDTGGHVAGDTLLTRIGRSLLSHIRANDTAARVGGDEFALILGKCPPEKAMDICENIRSTIASHPFVWEDNVYTVGVSIGITAITMDTRDSIELMKRVDTACYASKDSGRNRISQYREDDSSVLRRRQETDWVPQLTMALTKGRFKLFIQPIIALNNAEQLRPNYEVLIRLLDDAGNLVPPADFMPAAERYGLAPLLDRTVFDTAYAFLQNNPGALSRIASLSINLSGASISQDELLSHIINVISEGPVQAWRFQFEITETAAISNIIEAQRFMQQLRAIGCRVLLDDFGRGLSSFAYLKNLPIDTLKIDGMFIREMLHNKADHAMVRMINELAHALDIQTVAEFIEEQATLDCVKALGIDFAQGFHIARPVDIATLGTL